MPQFYPEFFDDAQEKQAIVGPILSIAGRAAAAAAPRLATMAPSISSWLARVSPRLASAAAARAGASAAPAAAQVAAQAAPAAARTWGQWGRGFARDMAVNTAAYAGLDAGYNALFGGGQPQPTGPGQPQADAQDLSPLSLEELRGALNHPDPQIRMFATQYAQQNLGIPFGQPLGGYQSLPGAGGQSLSMHMPLGAFLGAMGQNWAGRGGDPYHNLFRQPQSQQPAAQTGAPPAAQARPAAPAGPQVIYIPMQMPQAAAKPATPLATGGAPVKAPGAAPQPAATPTQGQPPATGLAGAQGAPPTANHGRILPGSKTGSWKIALVGRFDPQSVTTMGMTPGEASAAVASRNINRGSQLASRQLQNTASPVAGLAAQQTLNKGLPVAPAVQAPVTNTNLVAQNNAKMVAAGQNPTAYRNAWATQSAKYQNYARAERQAGRRALPYAQWSGGEGPTPFNQLQPAPQMAARPELGVPPAPAPQLVAAKPSPGFPPAPGQMVAQSPAEGSPPAPASQLVAKLPDNWYPPSPYMTAEAAVHEPGRATLQPSAGYGRPPINRPFDLLPTTAHQPLFKQLNAYERRVPPWQRPDETQLVAQRPDNWYPPNPRFASGELQGGGAEWPGEAAMSPIPGMGLPPGIRQGAALVPTKDWFQYQDDFIKRVPPWQRATAQMQQLSQISPDFWNQFGQQFMNSVGPVGVTPLSVTTRPGLFKQSSAPKEGQAFRPAFFRD